MLVGMTFASLSFASWAGSSRLKEHWHKDQAQKSRTRIRSAPGTAANGPREWDLGRERMPSDFTIAGTRFPTQERALLLAGTRIRYATVPYTPEILDSVSRLLGLRERNWPYWLEDWPATWALATLLAGEDPGAWPGPVLDLGCGGGVMGAWLRARFGIEPFSCDFNSDACRLAARNVAANGPADPAANAGKPARVFCADMRAFPMRARFGLVLAGEMLYARENQGPILAFLSAHLAVGGRCLLADKGRSAAEGFAAAARAAGFAVALREAEAEGKSARVFELRPGAA